MVGHTQEGKDTKLKRDCVTHPLNTNFVIHPVPPTCIRVWSKVHPKHRQVAKSARRNTNNYGDNEARKRENALYK